MKRKATIISTFLILVGGLLLPLMLAAQTVHVKPQWQQPAKLVRGNEAPVLAISFQGAIYPGQGLLPTLSRQVALPEGTLAVTASLSNIKYAPLTEEEIALASAILPGEPEVEVSVMYLQGKPVAVVNMLPFGIDPSSQRYSKVESADIVLHSNETRSVNDTIDIYKQGRYSNYSKLALGKWYKVLVNETGIYKLTYEELKSMGMPMNGINPNFISMYGYGGAMLPEVAGEKTNDDLTEISIKVVTAKQGVFAPGDYILFYGQGPVVWKQASAGGRIDHQTHLYTDQIAYFITPGAVPGKRIPDGEPVQGTANHQSNSYTALAVYEEENINIIKSGRKWFSNKLDIYNRLLNLPDYDFQDIDLNTPVSLSMGLAGRASVPMSFSLKVNGELIKNTTVDKYYGDNDYAAETVTTTTLKPSAGKLAIQLQFNPPSNGAIGWVDYVSLNVRSRLKFHGPQMSFRDPLSVGEGRITNFTLEATQATIELWDVTDHAYVHKVPVTRSGNAYNFTVSTPNLREFMAFDGTSYLTTIAAGEVQSQNLHSTGNYDLIIIAPPVFNSQAKRLANLHNNKGDIKAIVISLPQIYNEFSSGHQDITAIRDFMKMLYERGREKGYPKYMLMFGSASYDYKDRIPKNSNMVPTYQSPNSVKPVLSFLTDDYYGVLDDGEGSIGNQVRGLIDVVSGRFPVRTVEEATMAVNKVEAYLTNDDKTLGEWRNTLMVIADDEDDNLHFNQAERLTSRIKEKHPLFNVYKVYLDAFTQNSTPGGGRYPDANREIISIVDKGSLITNYVGHGGDVGWADERVLEISDINAWKNFNHMGLFFTATCEFSRFDNPEHVSAGELVFLNPEGGALALITTTRLAYSSTNDMLNMSFIDTALNNTAVIPRLGDILKYTKNDNTSSANNRHLTLLGDPALPLPLARHKVVTTSIVDAATLVGLDTLSANSLVTIHGEIVSNGNQLITGFNGDLFVKIYDKPRIFRTLAQDAKSQQADFEVQKNIIYQGKAKVEQGLFSFTFPVPRDIDYNFGNGKISYYATDGNVDAHGFSTDLVIGGSRELADVDITGPDITMFINDSTFVDGDITSENPKLLVNLFDISGINTLGNGVGHDVVAILDENSYNSVLLNDFYVADRDSYQAGWVNYQFFNLDDGPHTITLKAWDVFNNSSVAKINFVVKHDIRLNIDNVVAYPNPSRGEVTFSFDHNLFDEALDVEVEIYNSTGSLVRLVTPGKVVAQGYKVNEIHWDGLATGGKVLRAGMYVCRLKVRDRNGYSSAHSIKVIISK